MSAKILVLDIGKDKSYTISSDGRVYSKKRGKYLEPWLNMFGYLVVKIDNQNQLLHRLLAQSFIPNPDNLATVNHIDKNKTNNDLSNLEWMSIEDNVKHGLRRTYKLLSPKGKVVEFHGMAKFCKENRLTQPLISKVLAGERNHHKNWRKV